MTTRTTTAPLLETPPIPVQAKLAAAWTSFMFLYVYVDVFNFYKPGVVDGILKGMIWKFDISATLLTIFLVSVSIPALTASFTPCWAPKCSTICCMSMANMTARRALSTRGTTSPQLAR